MTEPQIILGIDPGCTVTGYSILKKINQKISILDYGYLPLPAKKHLSIRIGIFYEFFIKKLDSFPEVTHIALETPFLHKNAQSFLKLGYLRGVLYLIADKRKLGLFEFSPREVKLAVAGYGNASKEQVAKTLQLYFPNLTEQKKDDVTDAIAVSLCGAWSENVQG
jgi:crossover junction endodeoxyribonuclease RuvC